MVLDWRSNLVVVMLEVRLTGRVMEVLLDEIYQVPLNCTIDATSTVHLNSA